MDVELRLVSRFHRFLVRLVPPSAAGWTSLFYANWKDWKCFPSTKVKHMLGKWELTKSDPGQAFDHLLPRERERWTDKAMIEEITCLFSSIWQINKSLMAIQNSNEFHGPWWKLPDGFDNENKFRHAAGWWSLRLGLITCHSCGEEVGRRCHHM